jgi:beta-phosphoglucomutase-like phosphatase (HAD superfamily)
MITDKAIKEQVFRRDGSGTGAGMSPKVDWKELDAVLFDLDGVVTNTAKVHARAWKKTFDDYLRERAIRRDGIFHHFDLEKDYKRYVDGKPRNDGVADFLQSRDIYLPAGEEGDGPDKETICSLGNRKNKYFCKAIRKYGVEAYSSSIYFIRRLKSIGRKVAIVTSSQNCDEVLEAAGIAD